MRTNVTWHGTHEESFALVDAVARNCTCEFGPSGVRVQVCTAHTMLTDNQRTLDGLLFARRMVSRLLLEEFSTTSQRPIEP